jgi:proteic killer suppression protein
MWEILEHRRVERQVRRVPVEILKRYEKWKDIVQLSGPQGLRLIKGFHDEALSGDRRGQRSSRLSKQYRVIYRVERDRLIVEMLEVNPHDYRSKGR